jgi:nucleoside-diphosphate kinase
MVVSGPGAVKLVRMMLGATNPQEAAPGTIRGDFAIDISENIIHGSDSLESAEREISIFFGKNLDKLE